MVKIVFEGPLSRQYGKSVEIYENSFYSIKAKLKDLGILNEKDEVKPGYIVLVGDKDIRLFTDDERVLFNNEIRVIPINHGG
ncbi:hypothetical protein [Acidianus brierleyi]|uniref:Ubiquitin n=1 Tax=Acidianus brierleyi TaxID=41673 RepID=A0A2U9IET2_9CREN|nr:hypothetical protein [Acidianus brierleyi]AWR94454.1 hypothetical protein DFR85_07440 [Acidianus brierleyi]